MAAPANTIKSYDNVGIREDLSDVITMISPTETPFLSGMGTRKATNTYHEWLTEELADPVDSNAHVEGDDSSPEAAIAPTRLGNYTQIFKKVPSVAGTDTGLNKAGRGRQMAREVYKRTREMKRDMEKSVFANKAQDSGSVTGKRILAGVPGWVATNTANVGSGGSDPTGDGTDARTDGTQTALTQSDFNTVMQNVWTEGGDVDRVFLSPYQMAVVTAGFVGMNNQRSTIAASRGEDNMVVDAVNVYVTDFGTVKFVPSRHVRSRDVWIVEMDKWKWANLRPVKNTPLGKTGDSEKREIVAEATLCCLQEAANGGVVDCSTS